MEKLTLVVLKWSGKERSDLKRFFAHKSIIPIPISYTSLNFERFLKLEYLITPVSIKFWESSGRAGGLP